MPMATDELRALLDRLNAQTGASVSAIVTRSGVPVAAALSKDVPVDNFATMAATLLGALEVIFATVKEPPPTKLVLASDGGTLAVRTITSRLFLVALSKGTAPHLEAALEDAAARARGFLEKES